MIIDIVKSNFKIIIFGFFFTLFSSIGQSYFIGLFNPDIRKSLNISHGDFGVLYAIATLCSSIVLVWAGKKIDDIKLVNFSIFVVIFLSFSALFFSLINSSILLLVGIFFLRLSGQGLMAHTATTSISRYFDERRGKALSIVWLGLSTAEFLLPIIVIYFLSFFYWRTIWLSISIITIIILPIFSYYTIKDINIFSKDKSNNNIRINKFIKSWNRRDVLLDFKFYTILPGLFAPSMIITGVFVYQSFIAESKGWDVYVIPSAFMIYSITSVITLFVSGFLIDKFRSPKMLPFLNLPLAISLIVLVFFDHYYSAFIFMFFIGVNNGLSNVLTSSLWAELYGVRYLGSIKALSSSLMVFSSAIGTAVFGFLIDKDYTIEKIALFCAVYTLISIIINLVFQKKYKPILQNKT